MSTPTLANVNATNQASADRIELRPDLAYHPQNDAESHVVVEDPVTGAFYRLGKAEYRFVRLLETAKSTSAAWRAYVARERTSGVHSVSLTKQRAESLCRWLVANQLAYGATGAAPNTSKPKSTSNVAASAFFIRRPLASPDRLLKHMSQAAGPLASWQAHALGLVIAAAVVQSMSGRWGEFFDSYEKLITPDRAVFALIAWSVVKVVHELGHGLTCVRYGGSVREAGVAFVLFTPMAYVDVSSSWRFSSRWKRLHVAIAGVAVELVVAAGALLVWQHAVDPAVRQVAADIAMMSSVGAVLFNLNPLMRFDGYYVLVDLTGIDNLYQYGSSYARHFGKKYLLGLPGAAPALPMRWRRFIKAYGLAAALWRVSVAIGLITAAAALLEGAGIILAACGVFAFILKPIGRLLAFLRSERAARRLSVGRLAARTLLACGAAAIVVFVVPVRPFRTAPAIVEYNPPTVLRAPADAFVDRVHVANGQVVAEGDPIVTLRNETLHLELDAIEVVLTQSLQRVRSGRWTRESSKVQQAEADVAALTQQRDQLRRQVDELVVRAPHGGKVVSRRIKQLVGIYLPQGAEIAALGNERQKRLKISLTQADALTVDQLLDTPLSVRATGAKPLSVRVARLDSRANLEPPSAALAASNGGPLPVTTNRDGDFELTTPRVNAYAELDQQQSLGLHCGQTCVVTLGAGGRTIGQMLRDQLVGYWQ